MAREMTLTEIATFVKGQCVGTKAKPNGQEIRIHGVSNLEGATEGTITFADAAHREVAKQTKASAIILEKGAGDFPLPAIYVKDPRAAFAKLLLYFTPKIKIPVGISDLAFVDAEAEVDATAKVMPFAVVERGAVVGAHVTLYPHTYIGHGARIGAESILYPHVVVREGCTIGARCILQPGAVIGSDGFGFTTENGVHTKVPQVGNVVLEDDVEIGAASCIDRATTGSTVIGHGTKIDNLVHVGHNCHIGTGNLLVAQTGISGSTNTGANVTFGGQCGAVGHIEIGANSVYAARSGVIADMPEGFFGAGFPVQGHQEWLREKALSRKLPELLKRVRDLERTLKTLQEEHEVEN